MGRDGYRRPPSPGYRSRSPRSRSTSPRGRSLSPRGRPRSRSYSRSRSRSYSRSPRGPPGPRRGGSPGFGGWDPRGPPIGRKYSSRSPPGRKYSRSRSRSRTPSSDEPGQIHTAPAGRRQQRGPDADELSAQLQALKQQLEAEQVARAAAEGRLEFLKSKLLDVADRSKVRGNMLAQLTLAARRVAEAKQQLADAEAEMQQALTAAEAYLQDDAPAAAAKRQDEAGSSPAHQTAVALQLQEQQQQANGLGSAAAAPAAAMSEDAAEEAAVHQVEGGWTEAAPAAGQSSAAPAPTGPLTNIKFKLKL